MKNHTHSVDIRIQKFIQKKVSKFPELQDRNTSTARGSQGNIWDDIAGLLKSEGAR